MSAHEPVALMSTYEFFTLAIAMIGAILGVVNTWYIFNQNKVRIKVDVMLGVTLDSSNNFVLLQVTNLGSMAVSLLEAGLTLKDGRDIGALRDLGFSANLSFARIEPKAMVQTKLPASIARKLLSRYPLISAYATTACGTKVIHTGGGGVDTVNKFFADGVNPSNAG